MVGTAGNGHDAGRGDLAQKFILALLFMPAASLAQPLAPDLRCDLGRDVAVIPRLHDMPPLIRTDVERRVGDIAESGEPFEATDAYGAVHRPTHQFLRGIYIGRYWFVWYQHGGRGLHRHTLAYQIGTAGDRAHARAVASLMANLYGDPCLATHAILDGIRGADEF